MANSAFTKSTVDIPVSIAEGGTGSTSASDARTALGLAIGTHVQAYDADLTTWAGVTPGAGIATFLASPSSGNFRTAITGETGTGGVVFENTPTLVTPLLGTPTSGTLTNCTGLPVSTGISGLGTDVATFLATPSSANLAAAVTGETGSGALVFGTSPDFTTGATIGSVAIPTISSTSTLTNKRVQPRTASSTTASNLSPDLSTANVYFRTTQTATLTIDAPAGTPVIGETIAIYVDSAGAQTLTINSTYKVFGSAFPATTTAGKTFMMVAQYNGTDWKTTWANAV